MRFLLGCPAGCFVTVQKKKKKKEKRKLKSNFLYGLVISDYNGHYIWLCSKWEWDISFENRTRENFNFNVFPLHSLFIELNSAHACVFLHFHLLFLQFPLYNIFVFYLIAFYFWFFCIAFQALHRKISWREIVFFSLRLRWSIVQCIGNAFNELFSFSSFFIFGHLYLIS